MAKVYGFMGKEDLWQAWREACRFYGKDLGAAAYLFENGSDTSEMGFELDVMDLSITVLDNCPPRKAKRLDEIFESVILGDWRYS